eukprot:48886_1
MIERYEIKPNNNLNNLNDLNNTNNITSKTTTTSNHPTSTFNITLTSNIINIPRSSKPSKHQPNPKITSKQNNKASKSNSRPKGNINTTKSNKSNHQNQTTNTTASLSDNDKQNQLNYIHGSIPHKSLINQDSNSDMDEATEEIESTGKNELYKIMRNKVKNKRRTVKKQLKKK